MSRIKSTPTYFLTNITTHTPRNKYQIEILDKFGDFDRVITSNPEEYQQQIQKFCDDLFQKYPKCTRAVLDSGWLAPGEDLIYKVTFSGLVLIHIDMIKISNIMYYELKNDSREGTGNIKIAPVRLLIDMSEERYQHPKDKIWEQ